MKVLYSLVCIALVLMSGISLAQQFPDIDDTNYQESIVGLADLWVVKWYPDGTFGPDRGVTRGEMMKIVLEASLGDELPQDGQDCFPDVTSQWYAKYVCYAYNQWMIRGYPDGTFGPDQSVTIAEWLKIAINVFTDEVSEWQWLDRYQPYINFVHSNSIFSKYSLFADRSMTRSEMSELTYQFVLEDQWDRGFTGERDSRSVGCFADRNASTPSTKFEIRGDARSVITDIGKQVKHSEPTPLVLAFHGRTNNNTDVRGYYKVQREASWEGIWVYPSGRPENSSPRSRRAWWDLVDGMRGFEFFDSIIERYSQDYCIDMDQIYVVGHSLGWWFTNTLACARGDVIRAMWSVWGSITAQECTWPVSAMIMHHPEDRLASFAWGEQARNHLVEQNSCSWTSEVWISGPTWWNCITYAWCQEWSEVVWCPHSDSTAYDGRHYPHTWPNFAGEAIWEFFERNREESGE